MIQYEYAREALKRGMLLEEELGTNPFKFGLVGSTDDHTGISSAEENNFFGKFPASEPGAGALDRQRLRLRGPHHQGLAARRLRPDRRLGAPRTPAPRSGTR